MTVNELVEKLSAGFPAFTPSAASVWAPIFRATLGDREGPTLANAFRDTLASFEPTPRKGYPSPKDFLANLPMKQIDPGKDGPPLREPMARRKAEIVRLLADWWRAQGARIEEARGYLVADACRHIAADMAAIAAWKPDPAPVILTAEQIGIAEERAIARKRVAMFGALPARNDTWDEQRAAVRDAMKNPRPVRLSKGRKIEEAPVPAEPPPFTPGTSPSDKRAAQLAEQFRKRQDEAAASRHQAAE